MDTGSFSSHGKNPDPMCMSIALMEKKNSGLILNWSWRETIDYLRCNKMKSKRLLRGITNSSRPHGIATSGVEITNISSHGVWLLLGDRELFMSFEDLPWFKDADEFTDTLRS